MLYYIIYHISFLQEDHLCLCLHVKIKRDRTEKKQNNYTKAYNIKQAACSML